MGGYGRELWSHTRAAEFNILIDPEAADIVYRCGAPLSQVGLDVSMLYGTFGPQAACALADVSEIGEFCVRIQRVLDGYSRDLLNLEGFTLPDPMTVAVALDSTIVTRREHLRVDIETTGTHTCGATVVRHNATSDEPNVDVVLDVQPDGLARMLHQAVQNRANPNLYTKGERT
jgi:inosine-uridine nucleoside N-ribohydrolase